MPSTYAHYRLGQQLRKDTDEEIKQIINAYPQLYLIGTHGPDILFFYWPLVPTKVSRLGHEIHRKPGRTFFTFAREVIEKIAKEERDPYLAYAYGVLAHFSLDVTCHYAVFQDQFAKGLSHTEIESELDRELLAHDNKPTYRYDIARHLIASEENAKVIQAFYPGLTKKQIKASIQWMRFFHNLFLAPNPIKRNLIFTGMRLIGQYHKMHGFVMNYKENPIYHDTTQKLLSLYPSAHKKGNRLFKEFAAFLKREGELSSEFNLDFEQDYNRKNIRKE